MKRDIKDFKLEELKKEMTKLREESYRAQQIFSWIYKKGAGDFGQMKNLAGPLRDKLKNHFCISALELCKHLKASDKTEKFLFKLMDNRYIEGVIICAPERLTLCISTQVGCRFSCLFCASGLKGFIRNLTTAEILNQILYVRHVLGKDITNYVFMGMGEPLDNFDNVLKAIEIMNDPNALNVGARRITISTCGLIPGIKKLGDTKLQVNLSVSLHAATNELRNELVPINRRYGLAQLIKACHDYLAAGGRTITFEYVLLGGKNDSVKDASNLASIARDLNAKINLIPYSPVPALEFRPPFEKDILAFMKILTEKKVNATLRRSKGPEIQAACGQLYLRE